MDNQTYKYNAKIKRFLESAGLVLPLKNVAIAVSGGSDSVFLAKVLLCSLKPLLDKSSCVIIHVNHNWRGKESLKDQKFVEKLAEQLGVGCHIVSAMPDFSKKESKELQARNQRKEIFKKYKTVLTAHTADDLYETILWKTLKGQDPENGIKIVHNNEVRPILFLSKKEIQAYLVKSKQKWREDLTNHDGILLRSKMRKYLMPHLEKVFPDSKDLLVKKALKRQTF